MEDEAETTDVVETPVQTPAPARARRRIGPLGVVALVLIVALGAALVVSRVQLADRNSLDAARASAVTAARADASDVATYSYLHLARDFGRVERESTPAFRRTFVKSSGGLTKVLRQYKATARAKVLSAGVVSVSSSRAVVILFVNQTVTNTAQKSGGPTTDNSRIRVTLVRSGSGWLLDSLRLL